MNQREKKQTCVPTSTQIEQQLAQILSSAQFKDTPKLRHFLEYVVMETLGGRAGRIKGYSISSEVFGRSDPEEAGASAIVRVQASRLRRRLHDYYEGEGKRDPVLIEIPKGGYVPVFEFTRDGAAESMTHQHSKLQRENLGTPTGVELRSLVLVQWLLIAVLLLAVVAAIWQFSSTSQEKVRTPDSFIEKEYLQNSDNLSVMVFPFENLATGFSGEIFSKGITEDIITDLSKVPGIDVIALSSILSLKESMSDYMEIAHRLGVNYILRGSLRGGEPSENIRITAQLYDSSSGNQLWGRRFDRKMSDSLRMQDELATNIVQGMVESLPGVAPAVERESHVGNREAYELYKQAMHLVNPPADPWRLIAARRAFERVIELDPEWAGGYAGAAYTYAFHVWWGHSKEPVIDRSHALELADKALTLDSSFGLAYSALAFVYLSQRDFDRALSYSELAVKFQPGSPYIQAYHGFIQCANGDAETGLAFAQRALRLDPVYPRTPFMNILGIINFHAGNHVRAQELFQRNIERGGPNSPGTQVYLAATLASLGRLDEAGTIYKLIATQKEVFDYEAWLNRSFRREDDVKKVLHQLRKIEKYTSDASAS
ncbi:MAG TPA: hypothetical protein EYP19_03815 [Desulfobacterales bacterium]|nr:hypothetical protein [Desulfobacterales bacterium]